MAPWGEATLPRCYDQASATQQANLYQDPQDPTPTDPNIFDFLTFWLMANDEYQLNGHVLFRWLFSIHVHCFSPVNHQEYSSQRISKSFDISIFRKYNGWRPVVSPHSSCSRSGDRSPNTARGGQRFSRVPVEHEIDCGNLSMTISAVGMTICMIDSWYHVILTMYMMYIKRAILRDSYTKMNCGSQMFHQRLGFGSGSQVSVLQSLTCFACLLYLLWANKALGAEISWVPQCHHDVPLDSWRSSNIFTY